MDENPWSYHAWSARDYDYQTDDEQEEEMNAERRLAVLEIHYGNLKDLSLTMTQIISEHRALINNLRRRIDALEGK